MVRRHPIIGAVVFALVLLGIAILIGETTGDDASDSATTDAVSGNRFLSGATSSHALASGAGALVRKGYPESVTYRVILEVLEEEGVTEELPSAADLD